MIITSGPSNNSSSFAPALTWQRAERSVRVPWEVLQLFSYLSQGQPYQTTGPPRITLPLSIGLPPEEKKASHLSLLFSTSSPRLPPPLQPSALHLSRGSLQSQDNLETSAGSLPETLKKFPPSLILSLYPHLSCTPLHPLPPTPTAHPTSLPRQPSS